MDFLHKRTLFFLVLCNITSCITTKDIFSETRNPYDIAHRIQGVYVLTPHEDASNSQILVLSPILRLSGDISYSLTVDAVLVQRGQFFDDSSVRQWTALSVKDKAIHYPDGSLYGQFLNDDYTKVWIRDYSLDTDNEIEWESYYKKIK